MLDPTDVKITCYTVQPTYITEELIAGHKHYAKIDKIVEKYGNAVAPIFQSAYVWFVQNAETIVPKPIESESPIWGFLSMKNLEHHPNHQILKLSIPIHELILFDMQDWSKILNQEHLGLTAQDTLNFQNKYESQGIKDSSTIMTTPFYPLLKREIIASWQNLFAHHSYFMQQLTQGYNTSFPTIQIAIWLIKPEWVESIIHE